MSYVLSPEIDQLVQQKKASGGYDSEESVLRAALEALDEKESTLAAIQEGYDDYLAGRCLPLEEADRSFRSEHGIA
jgi:predicted transcriptional regulator